MGAMRSREAAIRRNASRARPATARTRCTMPPINLGICRTFIRTDARGAMSSTGSADGQRTISDEQADWLTANGLTERDVEILDQPVTGALRRRWRQHFIGDVGLDALHRCSACSPNTPRS